METTTPAPPAAAAGDQAPQLGAAHRVHAGGGLVEDQQLGLVQHRQGEGELLAHAAGEPAGEPVAGAVEARLLEEGCVPRVALGAGEAVGRGDEGDVLVDAEVVVQAGGAGDVADPAPRRPPHARRRGPDDAGQGAQQRRLAGAVAADHGGHGAGRHLEGHAVERVRAP